MPMKHTEGTLSLMHNTRPDLMTPYQRAVHASQDACRIENDRPEACDPAQGGISSICDVCRRRATGNLRNEGDWKAAELLEKGVLDL